MQGLPAHVRVSKARTSAACAECPGRCCTKLLGHTGVYLTPVEARREPFAQHVTVYRDTLLFDANGRCPFLGGDNRCNIYDRRPSGCRSHLCYRDVNTLRNTRSFKDAPKHRKLLDSHQMLPGQANGIPVDEVGPRYL